MPIKDPLIRSMVDRITARQPRAAVTAPGQRELKRYRFGDLSLLQVPDEPGCYLFWKGDQCFYVGLAGRPKAVSSLRSRLHEHHGRGPSISGSQFRRNVAEHLGFGERNEFKRRKNQIARKLTGPEQLKVNAFADDLEVEWELCGRDETENAEKRLIAKHQPLMNRDGVA